ncbi:MAG TPA: hypothetical protein VH083_19175 [Myxococcales bacterium]|jgi:hypothetical protein|nr:hypothetical protein [Myxococcales bacterium]
MRSLAFCCCFIAFGAGAQVLNVGGGPSTDYVNLRALVQPALEQFDVRGIIPISPGWSAALHGDEVHFSDQLQLGTAAVPRNLWELDASLSYSRPLSEGRGLAFTLGVGTTSDKPFHSIDETAISATALYSMPASANSRWLFGLNFSNNRPVLNYIPIPVVAWLFHYDTLEGSVGFPFASLRWRPAPAWDASAAIIATNISAEVGYRPVQPLRLSLGYAWAQQLWALADRADTSTRLFYDSMKTFAGVEFPIAPWLVMQLSGGYVFEERVFEGKSEFDRPVETAIAPNWFASATLKIPFPVAEARAAPPGARQTRAAGPP